MTREKAIRHFERYVNDDCYTIEHREYCRMAIDAIREQEERRWIPVTEKLPEPENRVLILTERQGYKGGIYHDVMCGFYEDGNILSDDSKVCWDCDMKRKELYVEEKDDFLVPEGWYEEMCNQIDDYNVAAIGDKVTHWMPLPEAAKEDAK